MITATGGKADKYYLFGREQERKYLRKQNKVVRMGVKMLKLDYERVLAKYRIQAKKGEVRNRM